MEQGARRSAAPRSDEVISDERYERYHRYAREQGTNRALYYLLRSLLLPAFLVWFRLARTGREYARLDGGMIVASNHRSFLDPFVIGVLLPWRRRMQFVAKVGLFESGWQGWVLSRLGAFPIRRGQSDETAMGNSGADRRAGRHGRHLSRGNPDPDQVAGPAAARASAASRSRPGRRCSRSPSAARAGPPRLDRRTQGQPAGRQADHFSPHGEALGGSPRP